MTIIPNLTVPGSYTIMQAASLGVLPMNAILTAVNGSNIGGPCPTVAAILSGGVAGVSVQGPVTTPIVQAGNASNPASGQLCAQPAGQAVSYGIVPITGNTPCAGLTFSQYGGN